MGNSVLEKMKWSKESCWLFVRLLCVLLPIITDVLSNVSLQMEMVDAASLFETVESKGEIWTEDILNSNKEFDNPLESITFCPSPITCISHCALRLGCVAVVVTPEKDSLVCRLYDEITGPRGSDGSRTWKVFPTSQLHKIEID